MRIITLFCALLLIVSSVVTYAADWQIAVVVTDDKVHEAEGGAEIQGDRFTIKAGGHDIWGSADQFTYVYQQISGDFEMVATVETLARANDWSKSGIMARQDLEPGSANVLIAPRGLDDLVTFQWRPAPNTDSSSERVTPQDASRPVTIRLTRTGDVFTGGWSLDGGKTWKKSVTRDNITPTPPTVVVLSEPILLGVAVTSHEAGVITTSEVTVLDAPFNLAVNQEDKLTTLWGSLKQ